jgi:3-phenylpropionate/trans-cinnamate dioxygenase ferredoxin subunit
VGGLLGVRVYNYSEIDAVQFEFVEISPLSDLPNGERLFVEVDDRSIVLFNIAGKVFAIEDICSHDDGPLGDGEIEGHQVICPRHGARFDVRTGEALTLPAIVDIPAYPIRVQEGMIELGIPAEDFEGSP